jgi:hypothetical protein
VALALDARANIVGNAIGRSEDRRRVPKLPLSRQAASKMTRCCSCSAFVLVVVVADRPFPQPDPAQQDFDPCCMVRAALDRALIQINCGSSGGPARDPLAPEHRPLH